MAKSNVIPFRKRRNAGGGRDRKRARGRLPKMEWRGSLKSRAAILLAMSIAVGGWLAHGGSGNFNSLLTLANTSKSDSLSASFSICGDGRHINCVVDGDTFWFEGEKIRIADIDTPEWSPPRCEAERIKGEEPKARLLALLNAGTFSLPTGSRDEDKYGRKLRTVTRAGRSLGSTLVHEGLARRWDGERHGWV